MIITLILILFGIISIIIIIFFLGLYVGRKISNSRAKKRLSKIIDSLKIKSIYSASCFPINKGYLFTNSAKMQPNDQISIAGLY